VNRENDAVGELGKLFRVGKHLFACAAPTEML
jgi:hypothetical protein